MRGNLSCTCLKNSTLLTELNALVRSSETSTQSGWSLSRFLIPLHYVLSQHLLACPHSKLHRGECTRELLLEVAHDGRADGLVEDSPYGNEFYYATIFLGYGNQPSTKEVWSEVLWDELVVGSYLLLLWLIDGIDSL